MAGTLSTKKFRVSLAESSSSISRAAKRIVVNYEVLRNAKLAAGDVLRITASDSLTKDDIPFAIGVAWPSQELDPSGNLYASFVQIIQVSSHLLLTCRISDGATACLTPILSSNKGGNRENMKLQDIKEASIVHVRETSHSQKSISRKDSDVDDEQSGKHDWLTLYLRDILIDLKYVTPYQVLEVIYEGRLRRFEFQNAITTPENTLLNVTNALSSMSLNRDRAWSVSWNTQVLIKESETKPILPVEMPSAYSTIGGLDKQISIIRDLIEIPLIKPELFHHFGLKPPRGILLYGPPGTGKTHLARAVANSTRVSTVTLSGASLASAYHGESEAKLRGVFREARSKSPCIVIIDEVDALCPRREEGAGSEVEKRVVATLLTEMDGIGTDDSSNIEERVILIATTNRPNAIDPALRRPGRFDREIEIGIPDAHARLSILRILLSKTPHNLTEEQLNSLASRTHGYVGADLGAVVRDAATNAIKRCMSVSSTIDGGAAILTHSDLEASLSHIRPSALREVFIETPQVRWSDIGGQAIIKQKLREVIEWPLLHPATFTRLGIVPPRGVLLYGPPGCSKTLMAKALATESGINFIAVKGPELLNKFVGESERAVRETFRKGRASAPSIIFFDEIDALATSRTNSEGAAHEGILTSLLNEMDGIQELSGVTIVAATNRPDVLDSALMRPGRLDRILYVGPPDLEGREEILRIRTSKMAVEPGLDIKHLATITEGCSGAELASLCQDAAMLSMHKDMDTPYVMVACSDFITAAQNVRRQITFEVIAHFETWKERSGVRSV
ncbi:hypothetical protein Clacol_003040 [Clathrus columnatus]|uniref:AAA+ ATPase domain-containing protein n=1 Tax=Clathrus columnatus TaxID=1419009 RepID=A0AAV5A2D1_9AGAM|nr:hypothetical protein Clacol_003040 [Clathrus columnatus]